MFDKIIKEEFNSETVSKGTTLFRARRKKPEEPFTHISELDVNRKNPANNRASPRGIPYMYLAEDPETAIAEIRANVGDEVTVATFKTRKDLNLFVLEAGAVASGEIGEEFDSFGVVRFVLMLSQTFSKPIHNPEEEYLVSQFFSSYCQSKGFDGLRYISSARGFKQDGTENRYNYVLFNPENMEYQEACDYKVRNITYDIQKGSEVLLK